MPRDPNITFIAENLIKIFSRKLTVSGIENLQKARESLNNGKSVILLANHSSHADHTILARSLRQNGFPDLAERIIFISGMKVKNEFLGRIFNDTYSRILVSTPSSEPQTDEENRNSQLINLKGLLGITRLLNQGNLLVFYAEGTRSRDKKLQKAISSVARYFENPNIQYLIPVGMQRTADLLPIGSMIPRFTNPKVAFGEPISPNELFNKIHKNLPHDLKNCEKQDIEARTKINEKTMDYLMKKIALLLPPELRGYYS